MKNFNAYRLFNKRLTFVIFLLCFFFYVFSQQKPDALKMYKAKQYKNAIEVCLNEIKLTPNNMDSYVVLTWALIADGQYLSAVEWCGKAKIISEYNPHILFSEAEAYYFLGENIEAINCFQKYIIYAPNGNRLPYVYYYFGEIYLRLKKYAHADIAFSTAVQLRSQLAPWWERLGYTREQLRDYFPALKAYEKALSLNQNLVDAQNGRRRVLDKLQR